MKGQDLSRYPYEGLVVTVGTLAVIVPMAWWLKTKSQEWEMAPFLLLCGAIVGCCLLIARWWDKRDAARKREDEQSHWREVDLPSSEHCNPSSHGKQE